MPSIHEVDPNTVNRICSTCRGAGNCANGDFVGEGYAAREGL